MRISTSAIAALLASAIAAPAAAQYRSAPAPQPQQPATDSNAQAQAQGQVRPSKAAQNAIMALQAAVNSNDLAAVRTKAAEAQAVAATKEDRYLVGQLQLKAGLTGNDMALASTGLDAIAASGFLDSGKVAQLYSSLGIKSYNAKQYSEAARMFERAATLNPRDIEALSFLGEAQFALGQKAQAAATLQRAVQASGARPPEAILKRAVAVAYEARVPAAAELAQQWVTAYPNAESWRNSIAIYRNISRPDLEGTVDLLRLMRAAGALTSASDLAMYLNALKEQSNFIEAQTAVASGRVDTSSSQIQALVAEVNSKPKVTAADLNAAAKSAQTGMALLRIGDRFYGLGDYRQAIELYKQAQARGADANLAKLRIGIALAGAGDKAGAIAALNSVGGTRAGIAKFWLLYLQGRG